MFFFKIMENSFRNRPKSVPGAPQAPLEVQAAPKSPQVEAESRPRSPESRPKSPQGAKSGPKGAQSGPKMEQNPEKNGGRIQNDFGEHICSERHQFGADLASPDLRKPL